MTRYNLDGYSMFNNAKYITDTYYNVDEVIDKARPKLR